MQLVVRKFCQLQQAQNIFKTSAMQKAIEESCAPKVHAWIFDIYSGLIKEKNFSE